MKFVIRRLFGMSKIGVAIAAGAIIFGGGTVVTRIIASPAGSHLNPAVSSPEASETPDATEVAQPESPEATKAPEIAEPTDTPEPAETEAPETAEPTDTPEASQSSETNSGGGGDSSSSSPSPEH